jgi:hypothetical protein
MAMSATPIRHPDEGTVESRLRALSLHGLSVELDRIWHELESAEARNDERVIRRLSRHHLRCLEKIAGIIRRPLPDERTCLYPYIGASIGAIVLWATVVHSHSVISACSHEYSP